VGKQLVHEYMSASVRLHISVELLVSPTDELGKLLAAFSRVQIQGTLDFAAAVQIAQVIHITVIGTPLEVCCPLTARAEASAQ
jgi:hypothetical protein